MGNASRCLVCRTVSPVSRLRKETVVKALRVVGYLVIYVPAILFVIGCLILCFLGVNCKKVTDPALNHVDSTSTRVYGESRDTRETRANENTFARCPRLGAASNLDGLLVVSGWPRVLPKETRE